MPTVRVGRRGQVTIPSEVRRRLELGEGDRLLLSVSQEEIVLRPLSSSILDLRGSIPVSGPQDFTQVRASAISSVAENLVRGTETNGRG
ncbi:MAG TPA: AbrB/MazE/SpoVT family DNA-binding domain-containing protein [Thermoleophilia bacterium]|nr:AbrB/MazE/SpoVT family DNA-binding domain-containing protein [Thermoleophilia bacterium]